MSFKKIPVGNNFPEDIYAIIEISAFSNPIKYEMNKTYNELFVDRFISSAMIYPCNYGYINNTQSLDGDPLDILIPTPYPLLAPSVIQCRPVGILMMQDESGDDSKIIAVPHNNISQEYNSIQDIIDFPILLKNQIQNFFENYKNLEKNKWVKIIEWQNKKNAILEIKNSIKRYEKIKK
ncbi:Inorganic pyrophosphatase [Buchnera aphidicola (Eriosoma grossulariae)]|uniref:inorganic diphosphatase n=1 Tax=Buchnera aphidicola TaxID=9 RepID=UPI003463E585